jgi:hypothetical protein
MPLAHYGVAIGTLVGFTRDPQHHYGSWYHGHVTLNAGGTIWESALDVDAPQAVGVSYRVVDDLRTQDLGPLGALGDGFHELVHGDTSGALDYVRSRALRDGLVVRRARGALLARRSRIAWSPPPSGIGLPGGPDPGDFGPPPFEPDQIDSALERWLRLMHRVPLKWLLPVLRWRSFPWLSSNGDNALDVLEPRLHAASRVYVFGERYSGGGNGVHDVHMNQGDPAGSQWFASNGTWQDGAVACQTADGRVAIWQVRFNTQSLNTDDQGHPA